MSSYCSTYHKRCGEQCCCLSVRRRIGTNIEYQRTKIERCTTHLRRGRLVLPIYVGSWLPWTLRMGIRLRADMLVKMWPSTRPQCLRLSWRAWCYDRHFDLMVMMLSTIRLELFLLWHCISLRERWNRSLLRRKKTAVQTPTTAAHQPNNDLST